MSKNICYNVGNDSWGNTTYKTNPINTDGENINIIIDADNCVHIANEYIRTNNQEIISLIDGYKYDAIYPNIFQPIARRENDYYINGICVTDRLDKFDFGH